MFRYVMSAMALKAFSLNSSTKRFYRSLGNVIGAKKRTDGKMPIYYFNRVNNMLRLSRRYGVPKDGDNILELGTGWLHWEAITCSLFFNTKGILFDVWDNRQINGLKNYISQLDGLLEKLETDDTKKNRAHRLIKDIINVKGFEDLYELFGFKYVVDPSGMLSKFKRNSFDFVISGGVLEHIPVNIAPESVNGISNVLKPGGYSFHSINLQDHLSYYDKTVSIKQYLQYSDSTWKKWFENDVQYINRIQRSDWINLFQKAGLLQVEEEIDFDDISGVSVAKVYNYCQEKDLRCVGLRLLHRKM